MDPTNNRYRTCFPGAKKFGAVILLVLVLLAGLLSPASSLANPGLVIPSNISVKSGGTVSVPVSYSSGGNQISSLVLSIDFDQTSLSFNSADGNGDGVPDAVHFNVPTQFSKTFNYLASDTDGELDIAIFSFSQNPSVLPDGTLLTIDFTANATTTQKTAAVNFSQDPSPSFGTTAGVSVSGTWQNGSVVIQPAATGGKSYLPNVMKMPSPTPTATFTPTQTPTNTATPRFTNTPTPTPTRTVTPTPTSTKANSCNDLVTNGGFESSTGWTTPATDYTAAYSTDRAHSGSWSMRIGIINSAHNKEAYSSASQIVTIPTDAKSAALSFWLYSYTTESQLFYQSKPLFSSIPYPAVLANDAQYVKILNAGGALLETLLTQKSNSPWTLRSYDLIYYKGQTIKLYFGAYNDGYGGVTGMYLDDVALSVCK